MVLPHYSYSKSSFDTVLTPDCDPQPCASGGRCLRRFGDLRKNTPLEFWSTYLVYLVVFSWFQALFVFSKSGQSDQMTLPERCGIMLLIVFQRFNSQAILGFCEPWSECQPEESRNDADSDDEPTTAMPHSHRQANTHRDQISRSGENRHSDISSGLSR